MDEKRFIIKRVFKSWAQFHRYVGDRGWAATEIWEGKIKLYRQWLDAKEYAFVDGSYCTSQEGLEVEVDQEIINKQER